MAVRGTPLSGKEVMPGVKYVVAWCTASQPRADSFSVRGLSQSNVEGSILVMLRLALGLLDDGEVNIKEVGSEQQHALLDGLVLHTDYHMVVAAVAAPFMAL